jgi:hypothetical protein
VENHVKSSPKETLTVFACCKKQLHFSLYYEKQLPEASLNPSPLHKRWKSIKLESFHAA